MARCLGIGQDNGISFLPADADWLLGQVEDLASVPDDQCGA
jgi:hypothetical protein